MLNDNNDTNTAALDLVSMVHAIDEQLAAAGQVPLLPKASRAVVTRRFVHFVVADDSFVVPIGLLVETGHLPDVTPLPNVNPSLRGVINFRGDVLPLFDLRCLMGHDHAFGESGERMMIVKTANSQGACALAVDRIAGLISLVPEDMQPAMNSYTNGFWDRQDSPIRLLDLERLFHHLSTEINLEEANPCSKNSII